MSDQKPRKRRGLLWLVLLLGAGVALFFFGPSLIHAVYRSGTSENERMGNKIRYDRLVFLGENAEGPVKERLDQERRRIFYWFHARGWNIDEGWHDSKPAGTTIREWRDLITYWGF